MSVPTAIVADAPRNDAEGAGYDGIYLTPANTP